MSKESTYSIPNGIILRETFDSEQGVRSRNGVPSNVTFKNGIAEFNGTTSTLQYPTYLKGNYSVRLKIFTSVQPTANAFLFDDSLIGTGFIVISANTLNITTQIGIKYNNGVPASTIVLNQWNDIVVTGLTLKGVFQLGKYHNGTSNYFNGKYELLEIYNRVLTASEVKNLYLNKTYKKLPQVINTVEKLGNNICTNGGGENATDFINPTNGLAQGWSNLYSNITPSIVTGNGFTGNAQRVQSSAANVQIGISFGNPYEYVSFRYSFKYRCNKQVNVYRRGNTTNADIILPPNTGNAITITGLATQSAYSALIFFMTAINNASIGDWFEIDEVTFKEVISTPKSLILSVDAYDGIIRNRLSGQKVNGNLVPTIINNNAIVEQDNGHNVIRFPSAAYLDLGNYHPLTGDITICGWVKIDNLKNFRYVLSNGKLDMAINPNSRSLQFSSDSVAYNYNITFSTNPSKWYFYCITRTVSGIGNRYLASLLEPPTLNNTGNVNTGTPIAGTTNMLISKNIIAQRDMKLSSLTVYEGLLSLDEITEHWSSTRQYL